MPSEDVKPLQTFRTDKCMCRQLKVMRPLKHKTFKFYEIKFDQHATFNFEEIS